MKTKGSIVDIDSFVEYKLLQSLNAQFFVRFDE